MESTLVRGRSFLVFSCYLLHSVVAQTVGRHRMIGRTSAARGPRVCRRACIRKVAPQSVAINELSGCAYCAVVVRGVRI